MGSSGGMVTSTQRRIRLAGVLGVGAALLLTGCAKMSGQAGPSSSQAPASASSVNCGQVSSLRSSLTSLAHINVNATSADRLAADLDNIRTQLHALDQQVATAFKSQENQLDAALDQLAAQARALAAHPSPAQLDRLGAAVTVLKAMGPPLLAAIESVCPGG
jgi:hypothetical protein